MKMCMFHTWFWVERKISPVESWNYPLVFMWECSLNSHYNYYPQAKNFLTAPQFLMASGTQ